MTCFLAIAVLAVPLSDVRLLGVVLSRDPARSSALLAGEGRTRVVLAGESAFGARIVSIHAGRVVLEADGEQRELLLSGPAASASLGGPARAAASPSEPAAASPSPGPTRTLDRADVERRLVQEIPRILAETTLLPVTDEGQVVGFTLTRLPEGSLLSDVGLQPGDVLTEVNGTPIDSLATLAGLYARLRGESEIRAVVLRGGSPQALALRLR